MGGLPRRGDQVSNNTIRKRIQRSFARLVAGFTLPVYLVGWGYLIWLESRLGLHTKYQDPPVILGFAAFAIVGSLLVARRPENPISWIMVTIGWLAGLVPAADTYAAYIMTTRGSPDALAILGAWINAWYFYLLIALTFIYLPLLFPDGHLLSRRWLFIAIIPGISTTVSVVYSALVDTLTGQYIKYRIDNPIGIAGMSSESDPIGGLVLIGLIIGLVGATAAVYVRYRRSTGVERQQLKWFLFVVVLFPFLLLPAGSLPLVGDLLFSAMVIALPTAIGVAVLRYRLYDIDIIIRRTLVYAVLTAMLALVYFGLVILLEGALRSLVGSSGQVATVISTLSIAALFTPLRRRVQDAIDRRFYRQKYDAEQALSEFVALARNETDPEALTTQVVAIVQNTMQPEQVSLWLRGDKKTRSGGLIP